MSARDRILQRIRAARGAGAAATDAEREAIEAVIRARAPGVRPAMNWELIPRFQEQCARMSSTFDTIDALADVPAAVARYLAAHALPTRATAWPEIASLDWASSGVTVEARPARGDDPVGITGAFLGVAETGTLMMVSGPETYAVTSLLPDTHVAVVRASRLVPSMEDAWARYRDERGDLPRAVNFISGPSRTADIEGQLQLGAHGPFRVHVILLRD